MRGRQRSYLRRSLYSVRVRVDGTAGVLDDRSVRCSDDEYIQALRAKSGAEHPTLPLAELRTTLRAALSRSFGRQLSDSDIDDLTQESLLRVVAHLDGFEQRSRFTTWAIAIAVRCALSELRRRRHQHVRLEEAVAEVDAALAVEPAFVDGAAEPRLDRLRRGIAEALTERQREAMLAALSGLPLMEIARRLGTSQGAVYKLLHDARRRLKSHLQAVERSGTTAGSP
jgi:RNA polymerase sigma-70 factor, ECF subfamily